MALPALLGAGARAVGGSMIKSGGRAVASKVMGRGRKKQTQPARIIPGRDVINGGKGGAIIKPNVKMVSAKEIKALQTGDTVSPGKDPLKSIYSNVILIEKILKGNNIADRDALKEQKKNDKKADKAAQEKKLETKPPKIDKKKGEVMKLPETGIFGFLKNFIGNILMGYFAVRLIKYLPQMMELLKGLGRVVEFVTDVGIFLVDGIASFINFAYNVYDGTRNIFKSVGLEGAFDGIMKAVEVAITVLTFALGAKSLGGFGGGKGGTAKTPKTRVRTKPQEAFQAGRPKRMQPPGTTSQGAASRYARRYGEGAAKRRFGQAAGKKAAQQAAGKLGVKGAARVLGPLVKRIPVIGGLIEFVLSVVSGDSVGKAAFRAVGSGLGTWIGGALGSLIPVPFVGTAIGAFVGGAGGAELAGAMYDAFFGGKEKQPESEEPEAKQSGGEVGRGFQEETIIQQKKSIRKKPSFTKIKEPKDEETESGLGGFLKFLGTGLTNIGFGGLTITNRVVDLGNSFGEYPYFGPILSLGSKVTLGETPDEEEYKNVGYGLNMLVGEGISKGMMSDDISKWVTAAFKKELSKTLNKNFDVMKSDDKDKKSSDPSPSRTKSSPTTSSPTTSSSSSVEVTPDTATGAIAASNLYTKIGANAEQWDVFRNSVALIESGGDYSVPGGSGMHYDGRYQMGAAAKTDGSRYAGVPDPGHSDDPNAQIRTAYRANKELQETIFTGFTLANHTYLMRNETYKGSNIERKLQILGYAHNQGMGGAESWITTGVVGSDGFGTKGTKYTDLIAANFKSQKSGADLKLASGAIEIHPEPKRSHAGTKLSNREQMLKILPGQSLLDENTSKALGATNLARFNAASTPQAIQNIAGQIAGVSDYAPYEQGAQQTVMVQDAPIQMPEDSPKSSGGGMMVVSGGASHDPFEFLDFQG